MSLKDLTDPQAVIKAMQEFDGSAPDDFYDKYGFGKARKFFVLHEGKQYDSKAILAVAHGYQFGRPLKNTFSGGQATVVPVLEGLGFEVVNNETDHEVAKLDSWSDQELSASVSAYMQMMLHETKSRPYSKRQTCQDLSRRFGRSTGAFQRRMQNISAVLDEMGREWLPGLKPAKHVGENVKLRLVALLERYKKSRSSSQKSDAAYKQKLPAIRDWLIEVARCEGKVTYGQIMKAFSIDRFSLRHAMDFLGHQADERDEPIITALIVGKKTQRCSSGIITEFGVHDDEAERRRLYNFWASRDNDSEEKQPFSSLEVKAARFVSVEARPDQAAFRNQVFRACNGRCIISGCDVVKALDAAHLKGRDWRLGHNSAEDGCLLRKDLHALYDGGLLHINAAGVVELDPTVVEHYQHFAGVKITRER